MTSKTKQIAVNRSQMKFNRDSQKKSLSWLILNELEATDNSSERTLCARI